MNPMFEWQNNIVLSLDNKIHIFELTCIFLSYGQSYRNKSTAKTVCELQLGG